MKTNFILFFLLASVVTSAQQTLTTFILLRHAEKINDGSKNPELTEQGKKRAETLVSIFKNTPVVAIYSTAFIRTRESVAQLAKAKSLEVGGYEAFKAEAIDKMVKDHEGKTVVICGHSNNIPWIANYLTGRENYKDFDDKDYGNILIVTVAEKGKAASVTWLNY